ncbi:lipoprotein-releasing system ATP-binding protein LolD 1 [Bryobacterales bacterium F-183]|nr:lipoprotein-releasing system ATP-binding protein LolD 1 [Bryobacterales bacterium F-183]
MLQLKRVNKDYATPQGPLPILRDVDLELARGSAVAVTGPSGSGKSTLLYVTGALDPPTSGEVTLDGKNPYLLGDSELSAYRNRSVGFVFQDHLLLPQCTALENVLVPALAGNRTTDAATEARAKALLDRVGLGSRLNHKPGALSGGERQRCAIARALLLEPVLLLCDEPTGNLDHTSAGNVADLLFELHAEQKTILITVTHSEELASRFPVRYRLNEQRLSAL